MEELVIPRKAARVVELLESSGHEAYLVGGWVRDKLMGRQGADIDIATSSPAESTMELLESHGLAVYPTGIKHGTVTAILEDEPFEITTFRVDGPYTDFRHPDSVRFCASIEEDLSRRDFTVNAIAFSPRRGMVDPFDGRGDIAQKLVRCVGDPDRRFSEDALRIMRGMRFSAQLGFAIDSQTADQMREHAGQLAHVSVERIGAEMGKLVTCDMATDAIRANMQVFLSALPEAEGKELEPGLIALDGFRVLSERRDADGQRDANGQHDADGRGGRQPGDLRHSGDMQHPDDLPTKLGALLHGFGAVGCGRMLSRLRFPKKTIVQTAKTVVALEDAAVRFRPAGRAAIAGQAIASRAIVERAIAGQKTIDDSTVRKAIHASGADAFFRMLDIAEALAAAEPAGYSFLTTDEITRIRTIARTCIDRGDPMSVSDLAISGNDLLAAGIEPGPAIGDTLEWLLELAMDGKCPNGHETMLKLALSHACER